MRTKKLFFEKYQKNKKLKHKIASDKYRAITMFKNLSSHRANISEVFAASLVKAATFSRTGSDQAKIMPLGKLHFVKSRIKNQVNFATRFIPNFKTLSSLSMEERKA